MIQWQNTLEEYTKNKFIGKMVLFEKWTVISSLGSFYVLHNFVLWQLDYHLDDSYVQLVRVWTVGLERGGLKVTGKRKIMD